MMKLTAASKDGTAIAYTRAGNGPAVILVGGGLTDRSEKGPLVPALTRCFTVVNYDRRGRGASDDAADYDVDREVEDIDALIAAMGDTAHLYGVSSGGALALEAAAAGSAVGKVAVYEVPYNLAPDWPQAWKSYTDELDRALAADDRGAALEAFLRVTRTPEQDLAGMRQAPFWSDLEAMAHTLRYDAACLGTGQPPIDRLATIRQPVLVLTGDERPPDGRGGSWPRAAEAGTLVLLVTHLQIDEMIEMPVHKVERQEELLQQLGSLVAARVSTAGAVWGRSRWDESTWMSGDDAELLEALRGGNARHTEDVLLILTARKRAATLATDDKGRSARARRLAVSTMSVEELRNLGGG